MAETRLLTKPTEFLQKPIHTRNIPLPCFKNGQSNARIIGGNLRYSGHRTEHSATILLQWPKRLQNIVRQMQTYNLYHAERTSRQTPTHSRKIQEPSREMRPQFFRNGQSDDILLVEISVTTFSENSAKIDKNAAMSDEMPRQKPI